MEYENSASHILTRLAIDFGAAFSASILVSPFINIVDRSIIENASGARRLTDGLRHLARDFVTRPWQFVRRRDFLLIYGLYTSTYIAANTIDTACEMTEIDNTIPRLAGVSAVNMTLCVLKDREFTRMFGVVAPTAVPLASLALFCGRDFMTMFASFTAPTLIAAKLEASHNMSPGTALTTAQMVGPAAVQLISTPLHLMGLDLYNNPSKPGWVGRIATNYVPSALARVCRIIPAFGIGGVSNKWFRDTLIREHTRRTTAVAGLASGSEARVMS